MLNRGAWVVAPVDARTLDNSQYACKSPLPKGYSPALDTASVRGDGDTSVHQVLGHGRRQDVLGLGDAEDGSEVDMTAHEVSRNKVASGVDAL